MNGDHNHETRVIKTDNSCNECIRVLSVVDSVLSEFKLVSTSTGMAFEPSMDGQLIVDVLANPKHNHMTRDLKKEGECPSCDLTHKFMALRRS